MFIISIMIGMIIGTIYVISIGFSILFFDFDILLWQSRQIFRLYVWLIPIDVEFISNLNSQFIDIALESFGLGRYIEESHYKPIHKDQFGELYRFFMFSDDMYTVVKVFNNTPELDGSFKSFYIRVHNRISTAHQAVAWTFNIPVDDYYPMIET